MNVEDCLDALDRLQGIMISIATGNASFEDVAEEYRELRSFLTKEPELKAQLPEYLLTCRSIQAFWESVRKPRFHQYSQRRAFIRESLEPVFLWLEDQATLAKSENTRKQPLTPEELSARRRIEAFLDVASEDQFTELLLVPLFQKLGFQRVSPAGHKEKTMEFGKDLWMKYQLPTGHWIYFGAQIKRDRLDSKGANPTGNIATVLTQARMAIDHPIFDPETNRHVLLDHLYLIAGGDITRAARLWLVEQLDKSQRRHIIFLDRAELLDQAARISEINLPELD